MSPTCVTESFLFDEAMKIELESVFTKWHLWNDECMGRISVFFYI